MRILQLNLNHCEAAQDLLCDTISRLRIDVAIFLCERAIQEPCSTQHMARRCRRPSSYLGAWRNSGAGAPSAGTSLLSRGPESAEFSFSASTLRQDSLRGDFSPPCQHHRGGPRQKAPCYCGGLQRMVDGVGM
ncbi:unnamed protein product [Trichogramma brassicae]|uniref:Uncharacterized protein n=1 Tax=Trichogramma brassicae TaxID=86971 RepID=A0A6H5IQG3_9HYME|nr:unnamed protein product [Trichogramma brassicae]